MAHPALQVVPLDVVLNRVRLNYQDYPCQQAFRSGLKRTGLGSEQIGT